MWFALGAASSILDGLSSLGSSKSSGKSGHGSGKPFDIFGNSGSDDNAKSGMFGSGAASSLSPQTMSALIAAQSQSQDQGTGTTSSSVDASLKDLFSLIDGNGDGKITKSEFESALGAGGTNTANADSVFGKLDSNGDGNVSLDELSSALKGKGHKHHQANGAGNSDPLLQALSAASSSSSKNSDGSTTTTLTYADGSKVTLTMPAKSANSVTSSYDLIEKLIQSEAKQLSQSTTAVNA